MSVSVSNASLGRPTSSSRDTFVPTFNRLQSKQGVCHAECPGTGAAVRAEIRRSRTVSRAITNLTAVWRADYKTYHTAAKHKLDVKRDVTRLKYA